MSDAKGIIVLGEIIDGKLSSITTEILGCGRKLADDLNKRFQNLCRVKIDKIDFVERGTIPEEHQTIVDERSWE